LNAASPFRQPWPLIVKQTKSSLGRLKGIGYVLRSQLFEGLSSADLNSVLAKAGKLRFHRNSVAVNQGHPADRLYLLTTGRARFFVVTHDGRKIILRWIVPGDVFGVGAIACKPCSYLVGVEMTQESAVLSWSRSSIRVLASRLPQLLENVILISQNYLEWYTAAHETLTSHSAGQRLALLLVRLSESIGEHVAAGVKLNVRNEELANAANMTVFTVSRLLREWQKKRIVSKTRNALVVRSTDLLLKTLPGE
jgi:CRP-like cAMP-binding protein